MDEKKPNGFFGPDGTGSATDTGGFLGPIQGNFPGIDEVKIIPKREKMVWQLHICPHLSEGWCRECVQSNVEAWSSRIESDLKCGVEAAIRDVKRDYAGAFDAFHLRVKKAVEVARKDEQEEIQRLNDFYSAEKTVNGRLTHLLNEMNSALSDLVMCHSEGGFVEPDKEVLDAARSVLEKFKGAS
jgi:hypothetical protein